MIRFMQKAAKSVLLALFIIILIVNVLLILGQVMSRERLSKVFGFAQVVVVSGSMEPAIRVGDLIVIREADAYETGDIVTYRAGETLITHRIVEIEGDALVLQGDANNTADEPVSPSQVEGKLFIRIPLLGRLSLFLRTGTGILLTGLSAVILILGSVLIDLRQKKTKEANR